MGPQAGEGSAPSVDSVYTPRTLPGLDTDTTYLHTQATVGIDSRKSAGYARRGGFYGVTGHDYTDRDDAFGFRQVDYEAIQHIPILRDTWVLSLRGLVKTTLAKSDENVPFFMTAVARRRIHLAWVLHISLPRPPQPSAAGRVAGHREPLHGDRGVPRRRQGRARTSDLDLKDLKTDYGFGLRFHAPLATVIRVDVARGSEGTRLVFAASPVF